MEKTRDIKIIANQLRNELVLNYYNKVHSQILPLEKLRIKLLSGQIIYFIILFSIFGFFIVFNYSNTQYYGVLMMLIIIIMLLPINTFEKQYREKLKKFYPQIIDSIGLNYCPYAEIHEITNRICNSKLFPTANQSVEEDIFSGEYKGVELTIAETKIIDSGYTHNNTTEKKTPITLYKGIIITLNSNKDIKSTTLIKPKVDLLVLKKFPTEFLILFWALFGLLLIIGGIVGAIQSGKISDCLPSLPFGLVFFAGFGWWFLDSAILRELRYKMNLEKVNLEDVTFSKHYQAYSYDQVEARYLISTAFIDRFMYLGEVFRTKNIRCSFVDNNLVIAIGSNKNNFEIGGLCTSLNNPKHIKSFIEQIVGILLIVDYLKLNENTKL